jgi:predicted enzyme related to lactoylglutathione lyase
MDMGAGGAYHIVSRGGVDRGAATSHLAPGVPPHWLPYVFVDDPDSTLAKAKKLGATIHVGPEDIPDVGSFGVLADPIGAVLAVRKPKPGQSQGWLAGALGAST